MERYARGEANRLCGRCDCGGNSLEEEVHLTTPLKRHDQTRV